MDASRGRWLQHLTFCVWCRNLSPLEVICHPQFITPSELVPFRTDAARASLVAEVQNRLGCRLCVQINVQGNINYSDSTSIGILPFFACIAFAFYLSCCTTSGAHDIGSFSVVLYGVKFLFKITMNRLSEGPV